MRSLRGIEAPNAPRPVGPDERHASVLWLVGAVLALAYGSLIPFDIDVPEFGKGLITGRLQVSWVGAGDALTNVLLYLPLGWLFAYRRGGEYRRKSTAVLTAIVFCVGVSFWLELSQTIVGSRVASWMDVLFNACGGAIGASAASMRLPQVIRKYVGTARIDPLKPAIVLLTVAVFVANLGPFDFIRSTEELRHAFLHARWGLSPDGLWNDLPGLPHGLVASLEGAVWFGSMAFLWVLAFSRDARRVRLTMVAAVRHAVVVAILIEFLQLFSAAHVFEMSEIVLRGVASLLGAWLGMRFVSSGSEAVRRSSGNATATMFLLGGIVLFLVAGTLIRMLEPSMAIGQTGNGLQVQWMPFVTAWRGSFANAVADSSSAVIRYGVLFAVCLAVARRGGFSRPVHVAVCTVLLFSCVAEVLGGMDAGHVADITHPILALVGAFAGLWWLRAPHPSPAPSG